MTTMFVKPKERQFQVVPVPAVFTRGRWECVDYKDGAAPSTASNDVTPVTPQAAQPSAVAAAGGGLPANSSVPHFDISISPSHSVPTTLGTEFVPPGVSSADSSTTSTGPGNAAAGATASGVNAVAIDNKIEQAMDLVKTHLTFAVREEVEILRQTITDLETRVSQLESENQMLRQFAPADVIARLAQQNTSQSQQPQPQVPMSSNGGGGNGNNKTPPRAPTSEPR